MANEEKKPAGTKKEYESYDLDANGIVAHIHIIDTGEFVPVYDVIMPGVGEATRVLLTSLRQELLSIVPIDTAKMADQEYAKELTVKYTNAARVVIDKYLPGTKEDTKKVLIAYIINIMLGLGDLEVLLADDSLEEIAVNSSKEGVWVFHKKYGWCKSSLKLFSDEVIYDHAEAIGRRIGRQISTLSPLMDAELADGSRVNATLFPISQNGNTITIRKFTKNPWTMPALIANKTVSPEVAAIIWECVQNEISLLISGGTASGKTSFLNAMSMLMPPSRRIISIEETRELTLPNFLQWVPMLTRPPNPEGKGEVGLYNLMVNSLRQRPDIILVGEVRSKYDGQTLFEAIHTGHAVYGTIHADNVLDTVIRMTNPPIEIPKIMLNSVGGIVSLFRHRRLGIRRVLEFGEMGQSGDAAVLYRWNMREDAVSRVSNMSRLSDIILLYAGYTQPELQESLNEKVKIMNWMVGNNIIGVDASGYVIAEYYKDKDRIVKLVDENAKYTPELLGLSR
ncbi:MAG: Flp pilus assembly complex ATPase component TadA [Candidatus Marsarchaeota archaeon]|nr:Flp pilus assembly complex ATPase component TadA [Candidatus Marsarchaeota archaeon]MCL5413016.1 Flp pilus assembly complex ATPase component TadA [Candidatus Marsarchaeota archaeon]